MQFLRSMRHNHSSDGDGSRLKERKDAALMTSATGVRVMSPSDIKPLKSTPLDGGKVVKLPESHTNNRHCHHQPEMIAKQDAEQVTLLQPHTQPRRRRRMWEMFVEKASLSSKSFRGKESSGSSGFQNQLSSEESGFLHDDQEITDMTIFTSMSTMDALSSTRTTLATASAFSSSHLQSSLRHHRSTAQPFSIMASQRIMEEAVSYEIKKHTLDELGYMSFCHDSLPDALEQAAQKHKPVFHFQAQIPGDVDAGREIFSHPLIVEAAQTLFVTVFPDTDTATPMARTPNGRICCTRVSLLDGDTGRQLGPLVSGETLTRTGLLKAMIYALEESGLVVPRYLSLLLEEELGYTTYMESGGCCCGSSEVGEATRLRCLQAHFAVDDPALAEAEMAGLDGVLATRTGTIERQKVIEVTYDSKKLSFCTIVRYALQQGVANAIYHASNEERMVAMMEVSRIRETVMVVRRPPEAAFEKSYDPKHALRQTPMRFVPLTPSQATRANRLIHYGSFNEAMQLLSPRQGLILMRAMRITAQQSLHEVVDETILLAWNSVCTQEHPRVLKRNSEPAPDDSSNDDGA